MSDNTPRSIFKIIGPGLLFAGSAVGVSHLVQSTRAGGTYGFALVIFILLALLAKYPAFVFAPSYAVATGKVTKKRAFVLLIRWPGANDF